MPGRTDARRTALQMLYLIDQNPEADVRRIREEINSQLSDETLSDFAWKIFTGVRELRASLDEQISAVAQNWRLERMAPTDRNALRLGLYEMTRLDTPPPVVLNECVDLAKEFGSANSGAFVNGILDKLRVLRSDSPTDSPVS